MPSSFAMAVATLGLQRAHLGCIHRSGPSLAGVDAIGHRHCDALHLPFAPDVRLELGEHAQHVEEGLARGRAGIDRLLGRLQGEAAPMTSNIETAKTDAADIDEMTIEEVRRELLAYSPATLPELVATEEHRERRARSWARLDALTRSAGG